MNKISIIAIVLSLVVSGFAIAKASSGAMFPTTAQYYVANKTVESFIDPTNGNICYMVLSTVTDADEPISCVADTVNYVQPVVVSTTNTVKK